jgi:hypothetical protein
MRHDLPQQLEPLAPLLGTSFARISLNREILSLEIPEAMEFAEKRLYQWFIACIGECVHLARRRVSSSAMPASVVMPRARMWWIDIDDAVRIYARMPRARLGSRRGGKAAL